MSVSMFFFFTDIDVNIVLNNPMQVQLKEK